MSGLAAGDRTKPLSVFAFSVLSTASVITDLVFAGRGGYLEDPANAVGQLAVSSLLVALTFWISLGRSRTGRLVYTGLTALIVVLIIVASWTGYPKVDGTTRENVRAAIETAIVMILLWWPSTSAWLRAENASDAARS